MLLIVEMLTYYIIWPISKLILLTTLVKIQQNGKKR